MPDAADSISLDRLRRVVVAAQGFARPRPAEPGIRDAFHAEFRGMGEALAASRPDALIVVAAEHFANFFMDNMPAYAMGMAEHYEGPIEDPGWLGIARTRIPGNAALSKRLVVSVMNEVDLAYAEEWKFAHGIIVPLHFLTPKFDTTIIPANAWPAKSSRSAATPT